MPMVTLQAGVDVTDPALAARWRELERRWDVPVFRRWCWVGCLAAQRYDDPVLAEFRRDGVLVGLGLFNRRGGRLGRTLHLHATGDAALDAVYVEHSGLLCAAADEVASTTALLREAGRQGYRVALPGVDPGVLAGAQAAGGVLEPLQSRGADYAALPASEDAYLAQLSRNGRAQLRRSDRAYAAWGPISAVRAAGAEQGEAWLDGLLELHLRTWAGRGTATAFTSAPAQDFVRALVREGVPRGDVELTRVSAGDRVIGYLLNLRTGETVSSYQSGFDYDSAPEHGKPGYTSHLAAIRVAIREGVREYDFLAGDAQYKRSLSTASRPVHWLTWQRRLSRSGAMAIVLQVARPIWRLHKWAATRPRKRQG